MKLPTHLGIALLALSLVVLPVSAADQTSDPARVQAQIKQLETEIAKFKQMLQETKGERDDLQQTLEKNEKEISNLMKKIQDLQQKIDAGKNKVSTLQNEQQDLQVARKQQQQLIAKQIRAAYRIGNQEYLKVVLNQQDPNRLSRMLTYYDYFNRARADQVKRYRRTIDRLENVKQQIVTENSRLQDNQQSLRDQEVALRTSRAARQKTLVALNSDIKRTGSQITVRTHNRERLESLLDRITADIANLPTPTDTVPFAAEKGKLLLPVAGNITNHFGSTRNDGKLRWNGIFIAAASGTPVKAVHYGRVVFSDWLRGFGLLLIINHGNGYMSLYGHNQVLYREVGDWVTAGETIATVGDSGGQKRPGLYFEIRHAGKPADPQLWCQSRPRSHA